ncbi:phage tail spike protein [Streptococcus anginosus]|nr:phage tail spike protein [Streptococcus anginosus]HEP2609949.1 phage tail protein [Streptococcus pyogenes]MED5855100.1 phage tail spike protein [Streptococcus anginosus]MED5968297.1 phage tail spike protein [Streptococcus anginosus]HEQ8148726.1 phage tail protein [Streptococcus pyogenes]
MLLTIHDANLRKVAFIDNEKQATLNYFNDTWTRYLETGSSTFDFTVFKKAIISDTGQKRAYNYLNEKAFVSFQYKGKTYLHTIRKVEESEQVIKCYGINLNLELINEYANPYKSPRSMSFKEYCDAMDLLNFTFLKIGVNEISTQKISAEWEGTDTKLNRLLSLAKKFGAEIEFDTHLNADSSIKSFVVNVYHENDDTHQGVGRVSPTVLKYGKNLKTLTRTIDKTNIYNMVVPTGRDDQGNTVNISGLGAWSVNNSKGEREFYQSGVALYAPLSMQMYPSTFTSNTGNLDQWTRKDMTVESANPEVIRSTAYRELKKNCYPAVTYEAEGFADLEIGDTVQVYDDGFSPTLLLEIRVSEQSISFTNPQNNKTTFSNAKALENRLSQGIQQRLDQMIEDAKPYTIKVATDNGVAFKNGQGQSVVTPTLMKGNKVINSGWRWVVNGEIKATSPSYIVKAVDVNQTMVLTVSAWVENQEVASEQVTFLNTSDGTKGAKGDRGEKGDKGDKGDRGERGERGLQGLQGLQGVKGDQGIPGAKGADGRTQYTHLAYADTISGGGFSQTNADKAYIGVYVDFTAQDSKNPADYRWTKWRGSDGQNGKDGAQGIPGKPGADGRTPYFHRAWANSADGRDGFSTSDSTNKRYLGTLTDFTEADSQDPSQYKWTALFDNVIGGNRNYFKNGRTQRINTGNATTYDMRTYIVDDFWKNPDRLKPNYVRISFEVSLSPALSKDTQVAVHFSATPWYNSWLTLKAGVTTPQKFEFIINLSGATETYKTNNVFVRFGTNHGFPANLAVTLDNAMLSIGTNFLGYVKAIEDVESDINSKADQVLTQEQLNALNEKAGIIQAELEAKASAATLDNWLKAYQDYVKANDKARAQAEKDLVSATQRVSTIAKDLGELSDRWNFIDTYMSSSNDGLVIGKNDGSSSMMFNPNGRISMYSAGVEVMYISQGVIHIENGIFSKTIQIGRFREEQYHLNADMNVIRYVGGA